MIIKTLRFKKVTSGILAVFLAASLGFSSSVYAASNDVNSRLINNAGNTLRTEGQGEGGEGGEEDPVEYEKINEEPEIIVEPVESEIDHQDTKIPESADRIHYIKLDDGQSAHSSDAILIESNGHYGLIDASNRSNEEDTPLSAYDAPNSASGVAVRNYLASLGVEHLDFVMATHSHSDHLGGIPQIVKEVASIDLIDEDSTAYDVKESLYDADGNELGDEQAQAIEEYIEHDKDYGKTEPDVITNESHVHMVDENTTYIFKGYTNVRSETGWKSDVYYQAAYKAMGDSIKLQVNKHSEGMEGLGAVYNANGSGDLDDTISFTFGDFNISLYNLYSQSTEDENANSIVTYIEKAGKKTVLLADIDVYNSIEQNLSKAIVAQHGTVDVIKVGHHGFTASTSKELIDTLSPKYAIIQTISRDLDGYSPFFGYMKQKNISMYRTMDASGNSIVQDMSDGLAFNMAAVVATEPEEIYRVIDTYSITSVYANYYAEKKDEPENPNPENPENPENTEGQQGLQGNGVSGSGVEGGEGDDELEYDVKQLVEKVETVTRTRKVIKNTKLEIGSSPKGWVQSRDGEGWAKWYTDWEKYDWVYVSKDGTLKKGWQTIHSKEVSHPGDFIYFFDEDGIMQTGWATKNGKKVFLLKEDYKNRPIGSLMVGWIKMDDDWYFFDADGTAHNGWINNDGTWYYSVDGKTYKDGFKEINGTKYYFGPDSELKTGLVTVDGEKYYLGDDGKPSAGWHKSGDTWYYSYADGKLKKNEWMDGCWLGADGAWTYQYKGSWKANSKGWWFEDESGWYPSGCWQTINGVKYYFGTDGYMASNEWVNGQWISSDGSSSYKFKGSWKNNSTGWWFEDETGWYPHSQWQKINGIWYYFEGSGYMAVNKYIDGYYVNASGACQ